MIAPVVERSLLVFSAADFNAVHSTENVCGTWRLSTQMARVAT